MKKLLFLLMLLMVVPSVGNAQRLQWEKGYFLDEFEDPMPEYPFYSLMLPMSNSDNYLRMRVSVAYGIEFILPYSSFGIYHELKIKKANGSVIVVPTSSDDEQVYQVDLSSFWDVVDLLAKGNITLSFIGYHDFTDTYAHTYTVKIKQQTQTITQILNKLGIRRY